MTTDLNIAVDHSTATSSLLVSPPRSLWLEFLLHFSSCGLYTSYWLFCRTREMNRVRNENFVPWLWLLAPFFSLALLVALPRFVAALNRWEKANQLSEWRAWRGVWYWLVFALAVCFNLPSFYETLIWCLPFGLVLWSGLFVVLQTRVDAIKRAQKNLAHQDRSMALAIPELLLIIIMLPLVLVISVILMWDAWKLSGLETYRQGIVYTNTQYQFRLPISMEGWAAVPAGTHSTGDAVLELQGPRMEMYFVVFHHDLNDSLNDIAYARLNEIKAEDADSQCQQKRVLSADGKSVIAKILCESIFLGSPYVNVVTVIETQAGVVELYGYFSSDARVFEKQRAAFVDMAAGFSPL